MDERKRVLRSMLVASGAAAVAIGSVSDARAALSLTAAGSPATVDFNDFRGTGFAPTPTAGQLDSDVWKVNTVNGETMEFGDTRRDTSSTATDDAAWQRGTSTSSMTEGIWAYDVDNDPAGTDYAFGVRPSAGSDPTWMGGSATTNLQRGFTLRIQNNTGQTLGSLSVSYEVHNLNDDPDATTFALAHSPTDVPAEYTVAGETLYTSPAAADAAPVWVKNDRSFTITNLALAPGDFYYLKWQGTGGNNGVRDAFALDDVSVTGSTEVPEPASLGLLGVATLAALRRRRQC